MHEIPEKYILEEMGFISDQKGILKRYEREKNNWKEHILRTKNHILQYCNNIDNNELYVLGSGWLLDFPIEKIYDRFDKIFLIDVYHPKKVTKQYESQNKVEFIEGDITGGLIEFTFNLVKNYIKYPNKPDIFSFNNFRIKNISNKAIISLNILNQLDILIIDYLLEFKIFNEDEILQIRKIIQENHISLLMQNKSCLITDYEQVNTCLKTKIQSKYNLLHINVPEKNKTEFWDWKFDNTGRYLKNNNVTLKVLATTFNIKNV